MASIDTKASTGRRSAHVPDQEPTVCTEVQLLGEFRLVVDGRHQALTRQCERLIALLALNERRMNRTQVATTLWPSCSESRSSANLRAVRWRLSTLVVPPLVQLDRRVVRLAAHLTVDTEEIKRVGRLVASGVHSAVGQLCGYDLLSPLLPGWYDDWVIFERERHAQSHHRLAEALVLDLIRRGQLAEANDLAYKLMAAEPLQEIGQRALVAVLCAEGEYALAARQLERYNALLRHEFGPRAVSTLTVDDVRQMCSRLAAGRPCGRTDALG